MKLCRGKRRGLWSHVALYFPYDASKTRNPLTSRTKTDFSRSVGSVDIEMVDELGWEIGYHLWHLEWKLPDGEEVADRHVLGVGSHWI